MRTDNYIYENGFSPEGTKTAIPAKYRIFTKKSGDTGSTLVGNCTSLSMSETRNVEPVRGIGKGIKIAELVPGYTEPIELQIALFHLYLANAMQIFGYRSGVDGFVRSLRHHQWPFDIRKELILSSLEASNVGANGTVEDGVGQGTQEATTDGIFNPSAGFQERSIVTIYEACWLSNYSVESQDQSNIITENCTVMVTEAIDGRYSGRVGAKTGNEPSSGGGSNKFNSGNLLNLLD